MYLFTFSKTNRLRDRVKNNLLVKIELWKLDYCVYQLKIHQNHISLLISRVKIDF